MLTAVQWRQMLGLQDFRSDHVFLREVAVKRMDEGVVQEWNLWVWAAETDRIGNSFSLPMVLRSSRRRGRAALPMLDGVSSCLRSHMMALTDVPWEQRVLLSC